MARANTQVKRGLRKGVTFFYKIYNKTERIFFYDATWEKNKKIPNFKGIDNNTQFLKGGQCNNPPKSDKE